MAEQRSTWGAGFIAGLAAKVMEAENQADHMYSLGIDSALGVEKNEYTAVFKQKTTKQARETIVSKTGIGKFQNTTDGADYNSDDRVSGYIVQINPQKYTSSICITEETRDDMDADIQSKMDEIRDLKVSYMTTLDDQAFAVVNYSQTAQASLPNYIFYYADGVPLASTLHPIKSSVNSTTTQSNASATGIVWSETNLETGRLALRNQRDDRNLPQNYGSGRIVALVPDALEKQAVIDTKSIRRSGSLTNDMNIYDGIVSVISTKWLNATSGTNGSNTRWALCDSMYSPLTVVERKSFTSTVWTDNRNKNIIYDGMFRGQAGARNWRGIWVSAGDGAAYAS